MYLYNTVKSRLEDKFDIEDQGILSKFVHEVKVRYTKSRLSWDVYRTKDKVWLDHVVYSSKKLGRPKGNILSVAGRTKAKRTTALRDTFSLEEIIAALEVELKERGNYKWSKIISDILSIR